MAKNEMHVNAAPDRVWDVLANPASYAYWVVGSKAIRDADPGWPNLGTKFHHTIGFGPLTLRDNTQVEDVNKPRRLVLRTRTRPLGAQRVTLTLEPAGTGTRVEMKENPVGVPLQIVSPPLDLVLHGRNEESLKRLKELAEERFRDDEHERDAREKGAVDAAATRTGAPV